ncbi:cadherin domain-containing protein [Fredinandcohnia sp. 179-A 10B2 NHS]|uniref:cadherin domain-containing protein n=1 Tax=Fredinandcohnia sp. 179-A 10B2 NHS TaxID=3235176 RepID=UPI0039A10D57
MKQLRIVLAFLLVLQVVLIGPASTQKQVRAESSSVTEGMIHQFSQNTWAYSRLAKSPNGTQYLSHVRNATEIALKKWSGSSWNEVTSLKTSASGDTGFNGPSDIAIDATESVHMAYLHYKGSGVTSTRGVKYGVYKNGSWTFQTIEEYSDSYGWKNMYDPSIAVDANGKAHIVYVFNDSNDPRKYEVHYATNASGSWAIQTLALGTSAIDEVHAPQVEVDKNNTVHVTYVKEDNQNDYYGNYYYTYKDANAPAFPAAKKIIDAVAEQKDYFYSPFAVDASGKLYVTFSEGSTWASDLDNEVFTTHFQTNQSGSWQREVLYSGTQYISYPISVEIQDSKAYVMMYKESKDWPPSELGYFVMVRDGGTWVTGTKTVSSSLVTLTPRELAFSVDSEENFTIVTLDDGLRNVSYLHGTSDDFGLVSISSNANLSNLTLSNGDLAPIFSSGTTEYNSSVASNVGSIQVTPIVADSKATVTVNGQVVVSGAVSQPIALSFGNNDISVVVTAEDGTVKTYTVKVRRMVSNNSSLSNLVISEGTLTPAFGSMTKDYRVSVPNNTASITLTPTVADSYATVTVNGIATTSGVPTTPISLSAGMNFIPVVVTAQDGSTSMYTVTVKRNQLPQSTDTSFTVNENASSGTVLGSIQGSDLDGDALTYRIVSGNETGVFDLDSETGVLKTSGLLDYESIDSYNLVIEVSDGVDRVTVNSTILINDVNDNLPIPQGFSTVIDENLASGTSVGSVTATDNDAGTTFSYSIIAGNESGAFSINAISGEISVLDATKLDFEKVKSFTLTVQVSDGTNTATTTVQIALFNLNDNLPVVEDATFSINENEDTGTLVGVVTASDADGDSLFYEIISGNEDGVFSINSSTGEIVIKDGSLLDYETTTTYELSVRALDTLVPQVDGPGSNVGVITIHVNDLNDNAPDLNGFEKSINENAANSTSIGTVTATDADTESTFTFSIVGGNESGAFAIDSTSGEITVADSTKLDYEVVKSFTLTVKVSDGINETETIVTIHLNNVNDNLPIVIDDVFSVDENAANGSLVGTVRGSDADGDVLRYEILSGNEAGAFSIDAVTGEVKVANSSLLDYEQTTSFELKVQASDSVITNLLVTPNSLFDKLYQLQTNVATIIINVNDLNDNTPVPQGFEMIIEENTSTGTSVGTVTATDADAGSSFVYSIVAGNEDGAFVINPVSGEVSVADESKLDFEKSNEFSLTIQVSDGTNVAETIVTITLTNVNDNVPIIDSTVFSVDENEENGTEVGQIVANDADGDTLTYRIISGNESGAFGISDVTGTITVTDTNLLDYEGQQTFNLTVEVYDGVHKTTAIVIIQINNLNDNVPVAEDVDVTVPENTGNGTEVANVSTVDMDGDSLIYTIVSGNEGNAFAIDSQTGKITVLDETKLDYEVTPSFTLTVEVSDGIHTAPAVVHIELSNVNDNAPTSEDVMFTVDEQAENSSLVGIVGVEDADGDSVTFEISAGNEDGTFTINEATGEITVLDASLLDAEEKAEHRLTVTINDGVHSAPVAVTIQVLSSDATLQDLTSNDGIMYPLFAPGITEYSVVVRERTDAIVFTPTSQSPYATIKINGKEIVSGQESEAISLDIGKNTVEIEVTAQNGQVTKYTLTVTRLKATVPAVPVYNGGTVTVADHDVELVDENGTLVVELTKELDSAQFVRFTASQMEILRSRNAKIKIVKKDVQLDIPARNFTGQDDVLFILERVTKKLPSSDLAKSTIYDFTIKQGSKVISHFEKAVELAFPTSDKNDKVYYLNESKQQWELVGGVHKDGYIHATTNHFSTFAVFSPNVFKEDKPSSGSELPKTATRQYNWLTVGFLLVMIGGALVVGQRVRRKA